MRIELLKRGDQLFGFIIPHEFQSQVRQKRVYAITVHTGIVPQVQVENSTMAVMPAPLMGIFDRKKMTGENLGPKIEQASVEEYSKSARNFSWQSLAPRVIELLVEDGTIR